MEKSKTEQTRLSIVVDKRHNTVYFIEPNGRSYIKKSTENIPRGRYETDNHI